VIGVARQQGERWVEMPPLVSGVGVNDQLRRPTMTIDDGRYYLFLSIHGTPVIDRGLSDLRDPKVFWYEPAGATARTRRWDTDPRIRHEPGLAHDTATCQARPRPPTASPEQRREPSASTEWCRGY
jgi:hypothetical protein